MALRTGLSLLLCAATVLAGCGGKGDPSKDLPDGGQTGTASSLAAAPAPTPKESDPVGAPVSDATWIRRVNAFCVSATADVNELFSSPKGPANPVGALQRLATSYRADVEHLARTQPPADERDEHFLVIANGRESAARLDAATATARQGDFDDAAGVAGDLGGLLPDLPAKVRARAPACENAPGASGSRPSTATTARP